MALKEKIATFLKRFSDVVLLGRNGSRIVLGTDRKDVRESGFGDGSDNEKPGSSMVDIVAGSTRENPDYIQDRSRIYVAAKTNPDEYFQMNLGKSEKETPAIVLFSDQVYTKARKNIKIKNENVTILIKQNGNIEIEATKNTKIKSGNSVMTLKSNGNIEIGAENGLKRRILTEQDLCVGISPVTGAPIISRFVDAPGVDALLGGKVNNKKVKIVI